MKKILLIILPLLLITACSDSIDFDDLVTRGGMFYEVNSDNPYSGDVVNYNKNNQKIMSAKLVNGRLNGRLVEMYDNGQKKEESTWKNGVLYGEFAKWYENGQKKDEGGIKGEVLYGIHSRWYENGQKSEEMDFGDGDEGLVYRKTWTKKGVLSDTYGVSKNK